MTIIRFQSHASLSQPAADKNYSDPESHSGGSFLKLEEVKVSEKWTSHVGSGCDNTGKAGDMYGSEIRYACGSYARSW